MKEELERGAVSKKVYTHNVKEKSVIVRTLGKEIEKTREKEIDCIKEISKKFNEE